jgi:tripartite-type tricarboxylate transporter receptor subunit TctC
MLQTNYMLNKEAGYTVDELAPIANIVTDPGVMVVRAESPIKTWQDFMDAAKKTPGKLTVGNSGAGGDDFFSVKMIESTAGISVSQVEFEGDGPSWQAALGGHIDASSTNVGVTFTMIKSGKLRALAVYSDKRIPFLPDVPTLKELGVNLTAGSSRGYSAPKGTPDYIVKYLAESLEKVSQDAEVKKTAEDMGMIIDFKKLDDYQKYLKEEEAKFKVIVDNMNKKS